MVFSSEMFYILILIENSTNDENYYQIKYINIKHHFFKQRTKLGQVTFDYVLSANNIANLFTKLLL